ncbi:MAG TPA: sensor histidine kinase [bacterium]|nr:sensor histidine kinase [bacterium]
MRGQASPAGIWTHRQRAVTLLDWVFLGGLALWRMLLGPWPFYLYQLAAASALYLVVRTAIVLRREVPAWAEYAFVFIDAAIVGVAIGMLGGLRSDFYLAYFFVFGEAAVTLDLWLVVALSGWITLGYVVATRPATFQTMWEVGYRLFFMLVAGVGAGWVAWREAARGREVADLRERLLLEEERRRLAREVHDGVGHILAAGTQSVELVERLLPTDPQRAAALLPDLKHLLRQGLDEIRLLVLGLRPPGPSAGDAVAAARQHLAALSTRTDITTEIHSPDTEIPLSPASEFAFRRILQEALTNIGRHARAGHVVVTLGRSGETVTCSVKDDGVGFDAGRDGHRSGFGFEHMRERAAELGGALTISSSPSGGTTIAFTLPLRGASRPPEWTS